MGRKFDPYHKWLGIAPDEQPADYYRLLAIKRFEADPDVIHAAADQRMAHLRNYQTGQHADLSQRLLNEVAAARVCLLTPAKKAAYDKQLQARAAKETAAAKENSSDDYKLQSPAPSFDLLDEAFQEMATRPVRPWRRRSVFGRRGMPLPSGKIVIGGVIVCAALIVASYWRQGVDSLRSAVANLLPQTATEDAPKPARPAVDADAKRAVPSSETAAKKGPERKAATLTVVPNAPPPPQSAVPWAQEFAPTAGPPRSVSSDKPGRGDTGRVNETPKSPPAMTAGRPAVTPAANAALGALGVNVPESKPPANETEAALADLASGKDVVIGKRLRLLAATAPAEPNREIAKALESVLVESTNMFHRADAARALVNWSTEEDLPVIVRTIKADRSPQVLTPLFEVAVKYRSEAAIEPIARHLSNGLTRREAGKALKEFGPIAEEAVIAQLEIGDTFSRQEVCEVLRMIGTRKSIPPLELTARDPDVFVSRAAKAALKTIRQAKRVPPKASKTAGGSEPSKKDTDRDSAGSAVEDGGKADSAGADSESP